MKTYKALLKSTAPYSQSKYHNVEKGEKEAWETWEKRTWRFRMHVSPGGTVFIPPMAIKNCLSEIAQFLSIKIPNKGHATYTKNFKSGIMVVDPIDTGVKADGVQGEELFLPSNCKPGGPRVLRIYPLIPEWEGWVTIHVIDETIESGILKYHLEQAGVLIGIGRFRPRNNGFYGRFDVKDFHEV